MRLKLDSISSLARPYNLFISDPNRMRCDVEKRLEISTYIHELPPRKKHRTENKYPDNFGELLLISDSTSRFTFGISPRDSPAPLHIVQEVEVLSWQNSTRFSFFPRWAKERFIVAMRRRVHTAVDESDLKENQKNKNKNIIIERWSYLVPKQQQQQWNATVV